MAETLHIDLKGPWPLETVFSADDIGRAGVYLFTIEQGDRYLTYYVGETHDFGQRLRAHIRGYVSWNYWLYDPESLKSGRLECVYNPNQGPNPNRDDCDYRAFFERYDQVTHAIREMLQSFRIFLLPIDGEPELRLGLEAAVVDALNRDERANHFLDVAPSSLRRREGDAPRVYVHINGADAVLGLPAELTL